MTQRGVEPPGNLEWRLRDFLRRLAFDQVARILAWIPILNTPPLAAIGMLAVRYIGGRVERLERNDWITIGIAVLNITVSASVLASVGATLTDMISDGLGWLRELLAAPQSGGVLQI